MPKQVFIIYCADATLYVESMSSFTTERVQALQLPTQAVADAFVDYMADKFFRGATWRVVPVVA